MLQKYIAHDHFSQELTFDITDADCELRNVTQKTFQ
jgi:hypothetical protein